MNIIKIIEDVSDIMIKKGLSKLEYADDECSFKLEIPVETACIPAINKNATVGVAEIPSVSKTKETIGNIVKSPIVGTYYGSPAPDKAPFVAVGQNVKKGDVIMIIESMKLMNEITSEYDGVVMKILVSDGMPVEFDQQLMVIE